MSTPNTPGLSTIESLLLAAMDRGDTNLETGRKIITFREGMAEEGIRSLRARSINVADAREFRDQAVDEMDVASAEALVFPEIGVALASDEAMAEHGLNDIAARSADPTILAIEPEQFVFASNSEFLRGFSSAVNAIIRDMGQTPAPTPPDELPDAEVLGATWGVVRCKVPPSVYSGAGIKIAVLDTGIDLGHPAFTGRIAATATFVGQPVQDLNGHGTHCAGTAAGPKAPAGNIPRYGIGHQARLFIGKVLTNSGSGTSASVLGGMNWAIANRCEVISMSLGGGSTVETAYTSAGAAALRNGCLIIAAAGNEYGQPTSAPANSPTIMAVASLDANLAPSAFSNRGKIEIAGPGGGVYSAWPRPTLYKTISGTSMATPHVAGCAALWAQTSAGLRAQALWNRLQATAKVLPYPLAQVGRGLVQAP